MTSYSIDLKQKNPLEKVLERNGFERLKGKCRLVPREATGMTRTRYSLKNYDFIICGECSNEKRYYFVIFPGGDDYGRISYNPKNNQINISSNLGKYIDDDYQEIYFEALRTKENLKLCEELRETIPGLRYLSSPEIENFIFLESLSNKIKENPILSFVYAIWNYNVSLFLSEETGLSSDTEVIGLIPSSEINIRKTTLSEIKGIFRCPKCKNLYIPPQPLSTYAFNDIQEKCEICSAGASKGERLINKLIRMSVIPSNFKKILNFERQYQLPDSEGQYSMDFFLEILNSKGKVESFALEVDGEYHNTDQIRINSDYVKTQVCKSMGIKVVRFRSRSVQEKRLSMLQKKFDPLYPILNSIDQDSIIVNTTNTLDTIFIAGSGGKYGIPKYSPAFTDEKTRADYFLNLLKK